MGESICIKLQCERTEVGFIRSYFLGEVLVGKNVLFCVCGIFFFRKRNKQVFA